MPAIYAVRADDDDPTKFAVWLEDFETYQARRAIPGVRFDTEHRAQLVADALNAAARRLGPGEGEGGFNLT